jgi:hypothetical protein
MLRLTSIRCENSWALEGLLSFQIHRGPAMTMQIKEVLRKELPVGGVTAFDKLSMPAADTINTDLTDSNKRQNVNRTEMTSIEPSKSLSDADEPTESDEEGENHCAAHLRSEPF